MNGSPKVGRRRLDALLVERGLAESRSRAEALILAGTVRVGDRVVTKAGSRIAPDEKLRVEAGERFVSRAGAKLEAALRVLDVDVGYGQLAWTLRNDPRVTVMERTNVRRLSGGELPFDPDLLVADLSFISLAVALGGLFATTPSLREAVLLVKPQFEAGPESVGRGGLVRDPG